MPRRPVLSQCPHRSHPGLEKCRQVKRTKQILSANSEAPISVEELFEDHDFRATITRDKFEELAGEGVLTQLLSTDRQSAAG